MGEEERGGPRGLCGVGDVECNCDNGDRDGDWARSGEIPGDRRDVVQGEFGPGQAAIDG